MAFDLVLNPSRFLRFALALPIGAAVLAIAGWMLIESRVELISDDKNIYIHKLPVEPRTAIWYRIGDAPFEPADMNWNAFYITVPLPAASRPERGAVPIDIKYVTWVGVTRTKRFSYDADGEQLRRWATGLSSSGWKSSFRIEGERLEVHTENQRCVRWTYGLDGEPPTRDVPAGATSIEIGQAKHVTMRTNLCHRIRQCTIEVPRDGEIDPLADFSCL